MEKEELLAGIRTHYPYTCAPRMGAGKAPAVLVVDFIEGFTSSESPLGGDWDGEIEATAQILKAAERSGVFTVFTTVEYVGDEGKKLLLGIKSPRVAVLEKGSRWTRVDPRLPRRDSDLVVSKQHGSAFFGTELAPQLSERRIDTLLICGCVTCRCVRASAVDAAQHGFRPLVVREAVGDRSPLANEANLIDIDQRYGDVVTLKEALDYLARMSGG